MRELKQLKTWISELDHEEKKELVEEFLGWAGLIWLVFMMSVIGG